LKEHASEEKSREILTMLRTNSSGQLIRDESSTPGPVPQRGAGAKFSVGLRSFPYLADHGVQNLVVLPGSFYVDLALSEHRKRFRRASATVRNAIFQNRIILSNDDTHITVKVTDCGTFVEYVFYEHSAALSSGLQPKSAAQLEIHPLIARSHETRSDSCSAESFQATAQVDLDGKQFYQTLRANGNRYGRHFQQLTSIWRDQDRVLAGINVPPRETESEAHACRPILLDVATQLLSAFTVEQGQTFILRSIQRIDIADLPYPDRLWAHATWLPDCDVQRRGSVGHVRVVDDAGRTYLELSGIRLTFLDRKALLTSDRSGNRTSNGRPATSF
jgi:acyl transferase domain-containing protein